MGETVAILLFLFAVLSNFSSRVHYRETIRWRQRRAGFCAVVLLVAAWTLLTVHSAAVPGWVFTQLVLVSLFLLIPYSLLLWLDEFDTETQRMMDEWLQCSTAKR